jgi:hypothetical protein
VRALRQLQRLFSPRLRPRLSRLSSPPLIRHASVPQPLELIEKLRPVIERGGPPAMAIRSMCAELDID